ncbi:hypothetical protein MHUMG1_06987 [Metarhizium humberi]|uniref:Uncharacterized protein n=1 Tax=Metarhizium humberi TaxID=2596975 RepID=A0A9P8M7I5_9HYPO|nr:hypothetical protein MHUMG1_06987 [Metarhizium humberi]
MIRSFEKCSAGVVKAGTNSFECKTKYTNTQSAASKNMNQVSLLCSPPHSPDSAPSIPSTLAISQQQPPPDPAAPSLRKSNHPGQPAQHIQEPALCTYILSRFASSKPSSLTHCQKKEEKKKKSRSRPSNARLVNPPTRVRDTKSAKQNNPPPPAAMPESSSSSFIDTIVHILQPIRSLNWTRYLGLITAALSLPLRLAWIPLSRLLALVTTLLAPAGYVLAYLGSWAAAVARFLVSLEPLYTFDEPEDASSHRRRSHRKQVYLEQQYLRPEPQGLEPDWHWADTAQAQAQSPARLRRVSGLQTETILEEDDSEE